MNGMIRELTWGMLCGVKKKGEKGAKGGKGVYIYEKRKGMRDDSEGND